MVTLTIDNKKISVPDGTTIMEAADSAGIPIPRLCYLKEINDIGACRVCLVEIEGNEKLVASCNNKVCEGMVVYTNSAKVRKNRKLTVEMLLSQHNGNCVTCFRNTNCSLQNLASELNVYEVKYDKDIEYQPWSKKFPLIRDARKCIKCMRCVQICSKIQNSDIWSVEGTGGRTSIYVEGNKKIEESNCALCGQCVTHCPVGALRERDDTEDVWHYIEDDSKIVVAQVAPAVRTSWGEGLGLAPSEATMGKIVDALKRIGFDYVFDTSFTADLTIMEEGTEFIDRYTSGKTKDFPMFTSCCPGWIRYVKSHHPQLVKNLSTAKSPQQMFGAVMKTYFAQKLNRNLEDIITVSIMPCIAKKGEANMELYYGEYAGKDIDRVLTTREMNRMINTAHIDPSTLVDMPCDSPMADSTGAGVIFGTTGGVMEAALRSAHYLITGSNPDPDAFSIVRSNREQTDWLEAQIDIGGNVIKAAVVNGLANTEKLITAIYDGKVHYDFVEVMACPGGCVGGGGQLIHDGEELATSRGDILHNLDQTSSIRFSHENKDVIKLYDEFLEKPNSHKAHQLLHTDHNNWQMPDGLMR